MELFTIGYEGRRLPDFVAALTEHRVEVLLDVRERAWSRKPGFSRGQLQRTLAEQGIEYLHEPRLGTPPDVRERYHASGEWEPFIAEVRRHLEQQRDVVAEHARQLAERRVCLLCFEADPLRCHRSAVAEALAAVTRAAPVHL